ncbi:MAG: RsmE family RNA methyltransferase, partial [Waddliaceae bacterium]
MPENRYFISQELKRKQTVTLEEKEHHHIFKVMRNTINDTIELVNGEGQLAKAVITNIDKKQVDLEVLTVDTFPAPPPLTLAQAIPRLNRLDFILEKGTELGMTSLWLFPGEKSEKTTISETQLARFHSILISAMKQSGALYLPRIEIKPPIKKWGSLPSHSCFGSLDINATPLINEK